MTNCIEVWFLIWEVKRVVASSRGTGGRLGFGMFVGSSGHVN